jgi:hypothetical protein
MALSTAQKKLYWRTWASIGSLIQADLPEATKKDVAGQRHGQHKAAGCPASSTSWGNADLDRWLRWAAVLADPDNLQARLDFEEVSHPEARRIRAIREMLAKISRPLSYAKACAHDPALPDDLTQWPASALQGALSALARTTRRAQLPGKSALPA